MEESKLFMNCLREARHNKSLDCQKSKFERLWMKDKGGHSNVNPYMSGHHSGKIVNSRQTATTITDNIINIKVGHKHVL